MLCDVRCSDRSRLFRMRGDSWLHTRSERFRCVFVDATGSFVACQALWLVRPKRCSFPVYNHPLSTVSRCMNLGHSHVHYIVLHTHQAQACDGLVDLCRWGMRSGEFIPVVF
ncbi:unnamed protein product [Ectocarpus sp. 8 AP-2014]